MAENIADLLANFNGIADQNQTNRMNEIMAKQAEKAASVSDTSKAKAISLGSDAYIHQLASAYLLGTEAGQNPIVQDFATMSSPELAAKYGYDVAKNQARFSKALSDIRTLKEQDRSAGQRVKDTGLAAMQTLDSMAYGVAGLGTQAIDSLSQFAADSANYYAGGDKFSGTNLTAGLVQAQEQNAQNYEDARSGIHNRQLQQDAVERELLSQDRAAQYDLNLRDGMNPVEAFARNFGNAAVDTTQAYINNPGVALDLVGQTAGSVLPFSVALKGIGSARAVSALMREQGLSRAAAQEALKTEVGRSLANKYALEAVPLVNAVAEGGSGVMQAQAEVLGMSAEDLAGNETYDALRKAGNTHDDALLKMAKSAGMVSGIVSGTIGGLAGKIAPEFEVNPLSLGIRKPGLTSAVVKGATTSLKEGSEEFLQEGGNQLGTNAGAMTVGDNRSLMEGVPEAATSGFIGGVVGTAAMQAPGVAKASVKPAAKLALNTTVGAAQLGAKAIGAVASPLINKAVSARDTQLDAVAPTGSKNTDGALQSIQDNVNTLLQPAQASSATETTDPAQAPATASPELSQKISDAAFVTGEAATTSAKNLDLTEHLQDGKLSRPLLIAKMLQRAKAMSQPEFLKANNLTDEASQKTLKQNLSLVIMGEMAQLHSLVSPEMDAEISKLPSDSAERKAYMGIKNALTKIDSNAEYVGALSTLQEITSDDVTGSDDVAGLIDFSQLSKENINTPVGQATRKNIETISRYNPSVLTEEQYGLVLDQMKGLNEKNPALLRTLKSARKFVAEERKLNERLAEIDAQVMEDINALPEAKREKALRRYEKSREKVRQEIRKTGDEGRNHLSLLGHRSKIEALIARGHTKKAAAAIKQLGNFAQSQLNKLDAFNQAAVEGGTGQGRDYTYYTGSTFVETENQPIFFNRKSRTSAALGAYVKADTDQVVALYNDMVKTHANVFETAPDTLTSPALDPAFDRALKRADRIDASRKAAQDAKAKQTKSAISLSKPTMAIAAKQEDVDFLNKTEQRFGTFDNMSEERLVATTEAITTIEEATGLDIMSKIKGVLSLTNKAALGYMNWEKGLLALRDDVADTLFTKASSMHTVIHEIGHLLDFRNGKMGSTESGRFSSKKQGDLYTEIIEFVKIDDDARDYFSYALDKNTDVEKSQELFAELFTLVFLHPHIAQEHLPNGTKLIEEIVTAHGGTVPGLARARELGRLPTGARSSAKGVRGKESKSSNATDESKAEPKQKLSEYFTGLLGETKNAFLSAFSLRKKADGQNVSSFLDQEKPLAAAYDKLAQQWEDGNLTDDQANVISAFVKGPMLAMIKKLQSRTAEIGADAKFVERVQNYLGNPEKLYEALRKANLRMFNLSRLNEETGKYELDPQIATAAIMAAAEYVMERAVKNNAIPDSKEILEIFGLPANAKVTANMREAFLTGMAQSDAIHDVARRIKHILGLQGNKNAPASDVDGIFTALAGEALRSFVDEGYLTRSENIEVVPAKKGKTAPVYFVGIKLADTDKVNDLLNPLRGQYGLFTKLFTEVIEKPRYIGTAPEVTARALLKNKLVKLGTKQRKVLADRNNAVHRVNTTMVKLLDSFKEQYMELKGYTPITETMNKEHALSVKGRNNEITSSVDNLDAYMAAVETYAKESGVSLEEAEIFFEHQFSSNGRMMQQGSFTPQGNKLARITLSGTHETLDLTDPQMERLMWLTIAQAADISITKMGIDEAVQQAQTLFLVPRRDLAPAVRIMKEALKKKRDFHLTEKEAEKLKAVFERAANHKNNPLPFTDVLFHATLTVARMQVAQEQGTEALKSFQNFLALEADGKTDGPINAIMHMLTSAFDPSIIEALAAGGLFFSDEEVNLNDYYMDRTRKDLYGIISASVTERLQQAYNPEHARIYSVLDALLPGFSATDNLIELARDVVKNPITVFIYGSGANGIAGKLLDSVYETLYQALSEVSAMLAANEIKSYKEHPLFALNPQLAETLTRFDGRFTSADQLFKNPKKFSVSDELHKALLAQVVPAVVEPLMEEIQAHTGNVYENMQLLQQVSNIQGIMFQDAFEKLAAAKLADMRDKAKHGDKALGTDELLPANVVKEIFIEAQNLAPIYYMEDQTYQITEPTEARTGQTLSVSIDKTSFTAAAKQIKPADASVKVSPYMVIGLGDGQMILNIYANQDGTMSVSLPVYDGIEQTVGNIEKGSEFINAQVFEGWMSEDAFGPVIESLQQTLSHMDVDNLSAENKARMKRSLGKGTIRDVLNSLQHAQNGHLANQRAIKRMNSFTDHMAGARRSHHNKGELLEANTERFSTEEMEAIAAKLNALREEELTAIEAEQDTAAERPLIQEETPVFMNKVREIGEAVSGYKTVTKLSPTGAKGKTSKGLSQLMQEAVGMTKDAQNVFWKLFRKEQAYADYTVYFGSIAELNKLKVALNKEAGGVLGTAPISAGQILDNHKIIFIANQSPETLLHELVHAYTVKRLQAYYADPSQFGPEIRAAVENLEVLMDDFLSMDLTYEDAQTRVAGDTLLTQLALYEDKISDPVQLKVAQMTEFLAWTLSNQNLIDKAKRTKSYRPFVRKLQKVLRALKKFLGLETYVGDDLFSNIQFNTEVLVKGFSPISLKAQRSADTMAVFNQLYGKNPRLEAIEARYARSMLTIGKQIKAHMSKSLSGRSGKTVSPQLLLDADQSAEQFIAAGFSLNEYEASVYKQIYAVMQSGNTLSIAATRRANELYRHVMENLTAEHFLEDPATASKAEKAVAQAKLEAMVTDKFHQTSANGSKDMLASFMALSQVSTEFRTALETLVLPMEKKFGKGVTVDGAIEAVSKEMLDFLANTSLKESAGNKRTLLALDAVASAFATFHDEKHVAADQLVMTAQDKLNDAGANLLEAGVKSTIRYAERKRQEASRKGNTVAKGAFAIMEFAAEIANRGSNGVFIEHSVTAFLNEHPGWHVVRELITDLRGQTNWNSALLGMMNKVKAQIDAMREQYRNQMPKTLNAAFKRKLNKGEKAHIYKGVVDLDLAALGVADMKILLSDPANASVMLQAEEEKLSSLVKDKSNLSVYRKKAKELAKYLAHRQTKTQNGNLLTNATAIARLLNENESLRTPISEELIESIDRLTSLYAFLELDQKTQDSLKELMENEAEGMNMLLGNVKFARDMELHHIPEGVDGNVARLNGWKGYSPTPFHEGRNVIIRNDADNLDLVKRGYVRVADYIHDSNEDATGSFGYYQTAVGGKGAFRQGIAQTVHERASGVDTRTGMSNTGYTTDLIVGEEARLLRAEMLANGSSNAFDALSPIFDKDGKLYGYERLLAPERVAALEPDHDPLRMIGMWYGRVFEEESANQFNAELLHQLKKDYDQAVSEGRDKEFVNVADPRQLDPVIKDAWDLLGWRLKKDAAEIFGETMFMPVRRDMVNNVIGYRAPGIRDAWSGVSRHNKEVLKTVRDVSYAVYGKNFYKHMVQAENMLRGSVSFAKDWIIIKSMRVAFDNLLSNQLHLLSWGIPLTKLYRLQADALREIQIYRKNMDEIIKLKTRLNAVPLDDEIGSQRILNQIALKEDANKKLRIAPLIDAGEFNTVSEGLTEADVALRDGKFFEYIENLSNKLPAGVSGAASNLLITKNSQLYKVLNHGVQYGDFVAKYALYTHLIESRGMTAEKAGKIVSEEFVNYNLLGGRFRDGLESFGMAWFLNYPLRITKIVRNMAVERPFSFLLYGAGIGPALGTDTVLSGSVPGKMFRNVFGYSFGPEMGFNSIGMNPFMSALGITR